jgi:hypothetical protein
MLAAAGAPSVSVLLAAVPLLLLPGVLAVVVPRYAAPRPNYEHANAGLPLVARAEHVVVFTPDPAVDGTYSHGAQIARHGGAFHLTWNNAAYNEDQDGMHPLYSSSANGRTWSQPVSLFPSMPASQFVSNPGAGPDKIHHHVMPFVTLNGRLYAVSNLRRHQVGAFFYPVPDDDLNATLLRRVLQPAALSPGGCGLPGAAVSAACPADSPRWSRPAFGPMVWATGVVPAGMENVSSSFGLRTAAEMSSRGRVSKELATDLAAFRDTRHARRYSPESCRAGPCGPHHGEQTVYSITGGSTDVILYRGQGGDLPAGWPGDQACANTSRCVLLSSSRDTSSSASSPWSPLAATDIPDLGSNLNAGTLADGRVWLVWNGVPRPGVNDTMCGRQSPVRNPLTLALSANGTVFERVWALYNSTRPKRFCGSAKPFGPSYPQAVEVTGEGALMDGIWTAYSINKEEIGVTFAPIASLKLDDDTAGSRVVPTHSAQIGTHVLVDAAGLDQQRTTAVWKVHRPTKDPANPIIQEDRPWEHRLHMFGSVVHTSNESDELLRIYYLVDGVSGIRNCVAESDNGGLTWQKPALGLTPWGNATNATANNILGSDIKLASSDYLGWVGRNDNPDDTDPSRRFIATMPTPSWLMDTLPSLCASPVQPNRKADAGFLAFSADGLSFQMPTNPNCYMQSKDDSANPIVFFKNSSILWFNRQDVMGKKTSTCPAFTAGPQRKIGVSSFASLLKPPTPGQWPARPTILTFDSEDPGCMDLYTSNAMRYEDAVLSFPTPFQHSPATGVYPDGRQVGSDGTLWTRIAASRDPTVASSLKYVGGDRSPWISRGDGVFDNISKTFSGEWDAGMAFAYQGLARARSRARLLHNTTAVSQCVQASQPLGATALTQKAWAIGCTEWDMLHQYYFGSQGTHRTQSRNYGNSTNGIGRVVLRRDGFASLSHEKSAHSSSYGLVVTKPFALPDPLAVCNAGDKLVLLVNVGLQQSQGSALIEIANAGKQSGTDFSNFGLNSSDAITADNVRAVASWHGRSDVTLAGGATLVLTFKLQNAHLYAWEWRCVKS